MPLSKQCLVLREDHIIIIIPTRVTLKLHQEHITILMAKCLKDRILRSPKIPMS